MDGEGNLVTEKILKKLGTIGKIYLNCRVDGGGKLNTL